VRFFKILPLGLTGIDGVSIWQVST